MEPRVLILFGSETGNAEEVAFDIQSILMAKGLPSEVKGMDDIGIIQLAEEKLVIFAISTTGDGEQPVNMKMLWSFLLRRSLPVDAFEAMQYAIFGLGDSSYDKFNAAARRLDTRLKQLGAQQICETGYGDDQAIYGLLTAFNVWIAKLTEQLLGLLGPSSAIVNLNSSETVEYTISLTTGPGPGPGSGSGAGAGAAFSFDYGVHNDSERLDNLNFLQYIHSNRPEGGSHLYAYEVISNTRMTAPSWPQNVRHLVLRRPAQQEAWVARGGGQVVLPLPSSDETHNTPLSEPPEPPTIEVASSSGSNLFPADSEYLPGDVAEVYYRNSQGLVQRALRLFETEGITAASTLTIRLNPTHPTTSNGSHRLHRKSRIGSVRCSAFALFERYLDVGSVPKRSYFRGLAAHAADPEEREKLLELSGAEGTDLYFDYCQRERRDHVEVLEEFRSVQVPLQCFLQLVPTVPPRQYSIASSPLASSVGHVQLDLCVAVAERVTPYKRRRTGLCSGYLASVTPGCTVLLRLKPGAIRGTPICPSPGNGNSIISRSSNSSGNNSGGGGGGGGGGGSSSEQMRGCSVWPPPLVLVGPGTGVAPMRALIQHHLLSQQRPRQPQLLGGQELGHQQRQEQGQGQDPIIQLFFGCRKRSQDFLFGAEWEAIITQRQQLGQQRGAIDIFGSECVPADSLSTPMPNALTAAAPLGTEGGGGGSGRGGGGSSDVVVHFAFSQEQLRKDYVTHRIREHGAAICHMLINGGGCVFVSGSAKRMPADVRAALSQALQQHAHLSQPEADRLLATMARTKRYIVEAWS